MEQVRIFPVGDGWTIAFGADYRSLPFPKETAMREAAKIASDAKLVAIGVADESGDIREWLPVGSLQPSS